MIGLENAFIILRNIYQLLSINQKSKKLKLWQH